LSTGYSLDPFPYASNYLVLLPTSKLTTHTHTSIH